MNYHILTVAAVCFLMVGCAGDPLSGPVEQPREPVLPKTPKYRWRTNDRLGGHLPPSITCVSISPDGKRCLAPSAEMLLLRSLPGGEVLREFEPTLASELTEFADDITCMAVDWKREISVTGDGRGLVRAWNLGTGKLIRAIQANQPLRGHGSGVESLGLSDDGRLIYSCGYDSGKRALVKIWELETGKLLRIVARAGGNTPNAPAVEPGPDGLLPKDYRADLQANTSYRRLVLVNGGMLCLLSGDVGYLALWDFSTDQAVWKDDSGDFSLFDATGDGTGSVELRPSDKKLVVRGANGKELRTIEISVPHGPESLVIFPDGKRAMTGGVEGDLVLWDIVNGMALRHWKSSKHSACIEAIAVSLEANTVLTGSADEVLQLWNLRTGEIERDLSPPKTRRGGPSPPPPLRK